MKTYFPISIVLLILLFSPSLFSQRVGYYSSGGTSFNSQEVVKTMSHIVGLPIDRVAVDQGIESVDDLSKLSEYDVVFLVDCSAHSEDLEVYSEAYLAFLNQGGLLFADYYSTVFSASIFGVKQSDTTVNNHYAIRLDSTAIGEGMQWLNDPLEQVIPLSKAGKTSFSVWELDTISAQPIAYYEDNTVAISCKSYGIGKAYFFGPSWKRLVAFPHNNKDASAQRTYSNGFEPGADIVPLLIRGIIEDHAELTVWKHTLPYDHKSTLMVTHDVDASSAYDTAQYFIDYELENNIPGHYFLTARYVDDAVDNAYYIESNGKQVLQNILEAGLTVGSHSVGHFDDFGNRDIFPLGTMDISKDTYSPYNNGDSTSGGTVLGELLVSKQILEEDGVPQIKSFRSGHLGFNKVQPEGLEIAGYKIESSLSANDVLTGFPYFLQKNQNSNERLVDVLEMPMHLSDVVDGIYVDTYLEAVDLWSSAYEKYCENYAPVTLLVHTTRSYKVAALDSFLQRVNEDTRLMNFEEVNDFWRARQDLSYTTSVDAGVLTITIPDEKLPIPSSLSLHLTKGKSLDQVIVLSSSGGPIDFVLLDWNEDSYLLRFESAIKDFVVETALLSDLLLEADFSFEGSAQVDFDSVYWDFGDRTSASVLSVNTITHSYTEPGYYNVSLSVWNNGVRTDINKQRMVYLPEPVSRISDDNMQLRNIIKVLPNPTTGKVYIQTEASYRSMVAELYDMQGHLLLHTSDMSDGLYIPIQSGVCFLKVWIDGEVYVQKIVKI